MTHTHTSCSYNGDCEWDHFCKSGLCEPRPELDCTVDDDCTGTDICEGGKCIYSHIHNSCDSDSPCEQGWYCKDNICEPVDHSDHTHNSCTWNSDCSTGEYCSSVNSNQYCEPLLHTLHSHTSCTETSDCASGEYCNSGSCEPTVHYNHNHCQIDSDCTGSKVCEYSLCVSPGHTHSVCETSADCNTMYEYCNNHKCEPLYE